MGMGMGSGRMGRCGMGGSGQIGGKVGNGQIVVCEIIVSA